MGTRRWTASSSKKGEWGMGGSVEGWRLVGGERLWRGEGGFGTRGMMGMRRWTADSSSRGKWGMGVMRAEVLLNLGSGAWMEGWAVIGGWGAGCA